METIRLQVFLSRQGVCSRRKAMDIIQAGQVSVNGKLTVEPSTPINPYKDKVSVNKENIVMKKYQYILLNKPGGWTTTKADQFAKKTVMDLLPRNLQHLNPVGRLDKDTEGLMLLTNDGNIAQQLTHPQYNIDKTYIVRINGKLHLADKSRLEKGVFIDNKKTAPAKIKSVRWHSANKVTEFLFIIHEGRKRQIRLMLAQLGHEVVYLKRVIQGPIVLGSLKPGCWRELTKQEIAEIKKISAR